MLPVVLPSEAWRVEDADEEIFLLYSQLQASGTVSAHDLESGGLGSVDSRKGELLVQIDVTPPVPGPSGARRRNKEEQKLHEPLELVLHQDTTALRSRQGDTGSVLWRASVHLARLLLSQQRFPPARPFLPSATLSTCHILEVGAGTGLLSIVLAPHVARYTATDLPALLPLMRKNQARNVAPAVLPRVRADDLDWVQLHTTPAHARAALFAVRAPAPPAAAPTPRGARKKAAPPAAAPRDPAPPGAAADADRAVDLVLAVDCIYNPALVGPLLSTLAHAAGPRRAPVLVVLELRAPDVAREFLERWLALPGAWEVWSVPLLGPRFAMWVGKRSGTTEGTQDRNIHPA